ncbi:MAG: TlyA family RNA methyltransferase [Planctomycetes bacterium]|nr:TlyA family RNA methyltransferase [Planctomycetota bacterium]
MDRALAARGLAPSRSAAQAWIRDGQVLVEGLVETRPARGVSPGARIEVLAGAPRFVSRGGTKLQAALDAFGVDPHGRVAADVGASTGGFTHCLLERGALRVHAIDVGRDQLHERLRHDPRVVVREGVDARSLAGLGEPVTLVAIDVAFVSARLLLPAVRAWLAPGADLLLLVKPQFEAGPGRAGRDGVVRDPRVHAEVLRAALDTLTGLGLSPLGVVPSPIRGGSGNVEFLAHARAGAASAPAWAWESAIADCVRCARAART